MTHRYLMDEHVHSFYPTLAERIGLNEAIVLQQIHSWIRTYTKDPKQFSAKHWHDGAWWIWNSYPEWHDKLPYLSESTIRRALVHMRELGILKVGNYNTLKIDRTYWYTIDYDAYDALMADQDTKTVAPSYQNGQMEDTNLTRPLPSSSPSSSASKEGATAPRAPADDSWPDEPAETEPETPPPNPAQERLDRMRAAFGDDPVSVAAHCQQAQEREGQWTVPVHSGLSPACAVFKEATGYRPAQAVRGDIDAMIPNNDEALHSWYRVAHGWILTGYSYKNVAGMLEWYAEGRVGRDKPKANGGPSTGRRPEQVISNDMVVM